MTYADVLKLNGQMNVARMMERDDFKKRFESGISITLTEFQYPLMQGHDSVMIRSDVELGGNDQLFNNLVGRDLQRDDGQSSQVVLVMPILEGLDGVQKMSKSLDNYIGVAESPQSMFGKAMSISDDLMERWYPLLTGGSMPALEHPMKNKKCLAHAICAKYHGIIEADAALMDFETRFSKKDLASADLPEMINPTTSLAVLELVEHAYHTVFSLKKSRGDIRKLILQGSVQIDGEKITDPTLKVNLKSGSILRLDKTHAVKIS